MAKNYRLFTHTNSKRSAATKMKNNNQLQKLFIETPTSWPALVF